MYDLNDKKAAVREVQSYLYECSRSEEFDLPQVVQDGEYGSETRRAVTLFQSAMHLPETGTVDRVTFDALYRESQKARECRTPESVFPSGKAESLARGSAGGDVIALHGVLADLSLFYPEIPAFSAESIAVFHAETETAVRAMQRRFLTEETGTADAVFYERLCLELRARKEIDRIRKSE